MGTFFSAIFRGVQHFLGFKACAPFKMASKAKVVIPPKHKYKSKKPVPDLEAEDQPYVVPQAEPVTNDADHPDGDGGVVCGLAFASVCACTTPACVRETNIFFLFCLNLFVRFTCGIIFEQCGAVTILILGFFIFPVWWGGCCQVCVPNTNKCAKNTNIASIVLGVFFSIWVPLLIALIIIPNIPSPYVANSPRHLYL